MTVELTRHQATFRDAMSQLSAAVNIVTTDGPGGRVGLTISAVCSVTDSPPTVLVCVNQSSYTHDIIRRNRRVCINVLGAGQSDIALDFAGATGLSMDERFARAEWRDAHGLPVLDGSVAALVGKVTGEAVQGSHTVMFVQIEDIVLGGVPGALVYAGRSFHDLPL